MQSAQVNSSLRARQSKTETKVQSAQVKVSEQDQSEENKTQTQSPINIGKHFRARPNNFWISLLLPSLLRFIHCSLNCFWFNCGDPSVVTVIVRECGHFPSLCRAAEPVLGSGFWILDSGFWVLVLIRGDTAQAHGKQQSSQSASQSYKTLWWMDTPTQPDWGMENGVEAWPIITSLTTRIQRMKNALEIFFPATNAGFDGMLMAVLEEHQYQMRRK